MELWNPVTSGTGRGPTNKLGGHGGVTTTIIITNNQGGLFSKAKAWPSEETEANN